METLVCESCDSKWERERVRGRKPKVCPSCKDGVVPAVATVSAGGDKRSVEYYISNYGYKPPKKSTYCQYDGHKTCKKFLYNPEYEYRCRCKCHV